MAVGGLVGASSQLELHWGNLAVAERFFAEVSELLGPKDPSEAALG